MNTCILQDRIISFTAVDSVKVINESTVQNDFGFALFLK